MQIFRNFSLLRVKKKEEIKSDLKLGRSETKNLNNDELESFYVSCKNLLTKE